MYWGENHIVLPTYAPDEPMMSRERITISVLTSHKGRWAGYEKWDEEDYPETDSYGFTTEIEAMCEWDDYADDWDIEDGVWQEVRSIDPQAEYEIVGRASVLGGMLRKSGV